uniref:3-isopropylmalate dehydratase small subunit n=1 Tax=Thermosporothrix sp. COM3 TaxID=2490863 RepID=A0A455SF98_9CHLR|nr:3-isopropylmalate dehydratase small subunit [Thermosporothrix sp. COM3]
MEALTVHQGKVMPLNRANVDTDAIIPAVYLKTVSRTGFADGLFAYWRYKDNSKEPNPDFELNQPRYKDATILLTRENFGCGSSREHAPWALHEYGFRVIIAPSFADIFYNNCFNIGLLPLKLPEETVQYLFQQVEANEGYSLTVDLGTQSVITPDQQTFTFEIDPFRKEALMLGLDAIDRTLQYQEDIAAFESRRKNTTPWFDAYAAS